MYTYIHIYIHTYMNRQMSFYLNYKNTRFKRKKSRKAKQPRTKLPLILNRSIEDTEEESVQQMEDVELIKPHD